MAQRRRGRNYKLLAGLILVAGVFLVLLGYYHPLTASDKMDGIIAVLFGLYTCSQPAANFLDLLLFYRSTVDHPSSLRSLLVWLVVNVLVLGVGWLVIVNGMIRFSAR
ncbi:MAG: hypothetical protein M1281_10510 [Chloroflexi bacterium]|nr:hypothetical protein [Chloroflexota bacterium]